MYYHDYDIILNIFLCIIVFQSENERKLLKQQICFQEKHYKDMIVSHEQIRRIRHDMKNHLNTIFLLYSKGSQEELLDYLHSASDLIGQTEQVISTGNPGFDAVLNMKLNERKDSSLRGCIFRNFSNTAILI